MSEFSPTLPTLEAFEPVEAMREEQSQLESWVHQSFAALERLHTELNDWQTELTKQQAELDQSRASLAECESNQQQYVGQINQLQQELESSREEIRQLEEDNAEQLQDFDDLDRQHAAVQAELRTVREFSESMATSLETERKRAEQQHLHWSGELKEMRQLLERQYLILQERATAGTIQPPSDSEDRSTDASVQDGDEVEASCREEIRRRVKSRRTARRRSRPEPESPT